MALLEIKKLGCPSLKLVAKDVRVVTDAVKQLVDDMFDTMYDAEGIGLAAPQVGAPDRIVVLDVSPSFPGFEPRALINPRIVCEAGEIVGEEGCLSLPGIEGDVKRAAQVKIEALDRDGELQSMNFDGIASRATQHEIDHLDGVLVIERFSTIRRNLLRNQLKKLRREGARQDPGVVAALPILTGLES
ncbi:MAG: peptide deformylase [Candidatus Latescibacterota bacterium]|nr:peptide deformylase [Candidatus Latescibacterota bacterium]